MVETVFRQKKCDEVFNTDYRRVYWGLEIDEGENRSIPLENDQYMGYGYALKKIKKEKIEKNGVLYLNSA